MKFYKADTFSNKFLNKTYDLTSTIIEIKYKSKDDKNIDSVTNYFPFRISKSSKYVKGISAIYGIWTLWYTYAVRRWAISGDIKMVSQEIGHSSVVMTEKYAKFNLRKLRDDFPSLKDRINLRLTPPSEDKYFTT